MPKYDHPNHVVIRDKHITAAGISATAVQSGYIGSTLRTRNKAVVVGCAFRVGSGGSAAGTNSIAIARILAGGSKSSWQVSTIAMSAGASAAGDVYDISLVSAMTIASLGDCALLRPNAASIDKVAVLTDIVWRYRILPGGDDELTHVALG